MTRTAQNFKPILAAVVLAFSFVAMGVWVRMMAGSFASWQQVYARMLLAAILALVIFRRQVDLKFWRSIRPQEWGIYLIRAVLANAIGVGFFTLAVQSAPLATVSFVSSLPLLGLMGWLLFGEKVSLRTLPFIGLSVVGLMMLTGVSASHFVLGWGELAALVGMLGFDLGYLMSRFHPQRYSNIQNTTAMLCVVWIPLLTISLAVRELLLATCCYLRACLPWQSDLYSMMNGRVGMS